MSKKKEVTEKLNTVKDLEPKAEDVKGGLASSVLKKLNDVNNGVINKI